MILLLVLSADARNRCLSIKRPHNPLNGELSSTGLRRGPDSGSADWSGRCLIIYVFEKGDNEFHHILYVKLITSFHRASVQGSRADVWLSRNQDPTSTRDTGVKNSNACILQAGIGGRKGQLKANSTVKGISMRLRHSLFLSILLLFSLIRAQAQTFAVNPETGETEAQFAARAPGTAAFFRPCSATTSSSPTATPKTRPAAS